MWCVDVCSGSVSAILTMHASGNFGRERQRAEHHVDQELFHREEL
jgi:hypothetical protein